MRRDRGLDRYLRVDEDVLRAADVHEVRGRARRGLQAQGERDPEVQLVGHLHARPEGERRRREAVGVELRVEAVREVLLALVVEERGRAGELVVRDHRVETEPHAAFEELRDEADHLIEANVLARARALPRARLQRLVRGLRGLSVLEPVGGHAVGGVATAARALGVLGARSDVHRGIRAPLEVHADLVGEREDAKLEALVRIGQEGRVEVRRRRSRLAAAPAEAAALRAGELEERGSRRRRTHERDRSGQRPRWRPRKKGSPPRAGTPSCHWLASGTRVLRSARTDSQIVGSVPTAWPSLSLWNHA